LIAQADLILALEPVDFYGQINRMRDLIERITSPATKPGVKLVSIGTHDLLVHANYQDFQRYTQIDLPIVGDAEATMPSLIEAWQKDWTEARKPALADRGKKLADAAKGFVERARADAAYAWDASPISSARLYMELWNQIKNQDWAMVSTSSFSSDWPFRL